MWRHMTSSYVQGIYNTVGKEKKNNNNECKNSKKEFICSVHAKMRPMRALQTQRK